MLLLLGQGGKARLAISTKSSDLEDGAGQMMAQLIPSDSFRARPFHPPLQEPPLPALQTSLLLLAAAATCFYTGTNFLHALLLLTPLAS